MKKYLIIVFFITLMFIQGVYSGGFGGTVLPPHKGTFKVLSIQRIDAGDIYYHNNETFIETFYFTIHVYDNNVKVNQYSFTYQYTTLLIKDILNNVYYNNTYYLNTYGYNNEYNFDTYYTRFYFEDFNTTHYAIYLMSLNLNIYINKSNTIYIETKEPTGYFRIIGEYVESQLPQEEETEQGEIILSGFTSRFLLRRPENDNITINLKAKFYTNIELRNITYLDYNNVTNYVIVNNTVILYGENLYLRLTSTSIYTPLVIPYNNYLYFINNIVSENNTYVFKYYSVYKIVESPHIVIDNLSGETYFFKFTLVSVDKDLAPPPPVTRFNSLFASYEYTPGIGWILLLKFSTEIGTQEYYVDLNTIVFYSVRVFNITSINNLDIHDLLDNSKRILEGIISTVSFYYNIKTNLRSVFIASTEKYLELNVPVNVTKYVYVIQKPQALTCSELSGLLNISTSFLLCFEFTKKDIVNYTEQDKVIVEVEHKQVEIKQYDIPEWYNLPAWLSLISQVFIDTITLVFEIFRLMSTMFISLLFNKTVWSMFLLFIVFAHIIIFVTNPSELYTLYRDLSDLLIKAITIIYDIIMKLVQAIASLIEAINPF